MRVSKNLNSLGYFSISEKNQAALEKSQQTPPKLSVRLCLKRHRLILLSLRHDHRGGRE